MIFTAFMCRAAPVALALLAAPLGALDAYRVMDGTGELTIYGVDSTVLAVERPGAAGEAFYYGAGGFYAGSGRPDPIFGGVVFTDASGAVVGRMVPNYSCGWDHFRADGAYRGMSVVVPGDSWDVDPHGAIMPDGLFPVPMSWSQQLNLPNATAP
ncbi:MAG: hypothetical protein AAB263_08945 [Planctomycetota bacterium]